MVLDKILDCPVMATIQAMGGKWRPRILWRLREGSATFGELSRFVGVSEKVLHENLRALQRAGLISRKPVEDGEVVLVEYSYSDYGLSLVPVLDAMGAWGLRHQGLVGQVKSPGTGNPLPR